jgi:hypothetical protein
MVEEPKYQLRLTLNDHFAKVHAITRTIHRLVPSLNCCAGTTFRLDYGNQLRIQVEWYQGSAKVIRLTLPWHEGAPSFATSAPMDVASSPLAP